MHGKNWGIPTNFFQAFCMEWWWIIMNFHNLWDAFPIAGNSLRDSWWSYSVWVALSYWIDVIFYCRLRWPMEDHSHAHASLLKRGRYRYKTSIRNLYKVYQLLHNDKFLHVRLYFKQLSTCQSAVQSLYQCLQPTLENPYCTSAEVVLLNLWSNF